MYSKQSPYWPIMVPWRVAAGGNQIKHSACIAARERISQRAEQIFAATARISDAVANLVFRVQ